MVPIFMADVLLWQFLIEPAVSHDLRASELRAREQSPAAVLFLEGAGDIRLAG